MILWIVTFTLDDTQFLVEANTEKEAINIAHEHNKMIGDIIDYNFGEIWYDDYSAKKANMNNISDLIKRYEFQFGTEDAIVFN